MAQNEYDPFDEIKKCRTEVDAALQELHTIVETKTKQLTPVEIEAIAESAANKAIVKLTNMAYLEIGKGVVTKTIKIIGIVAVMLSFYFHDKIFLK